MPHRNQVLFSCVNVKHVKLSLESHVSNKEGGQARTQIARPIAAIQALWYPNTISFLLTHTGFTIIGESVSRPAAALDFQVTQVITHLFTATIVKLTQVCQGTWNREDKLVKFK